MGKNNNNSQRLSVKATVIKYQLSKLLVSN